MSKEIKKLEKEREADSKLDEKQVMKGDKMKKYKVEFKKHNGSFEDWIGEPVDAVDAVDALKVAKKWLIMHGKDPDKIAIHTTECNSKVLSSVEVIKLVVAFLAGEIVKDDISGDEVAMRAVYGLLDVSKELDRVAKRYVRGVGL